MTWTHSILGFAFLLGVALTAEASKPVEQIEKALAADNQTATDYRNTVRELLPLVEENRLVSRELRSALEDVKKASDEDRAVRRLRSALKESKSILEFEPLMESKLPKGFPEPTPLGVIRVQNYPAYRLAQAQGGRSAFMTLFGHITSNGISMTAPVEMTYKQKKGDLEASSMAFLYGNQKIGTLGKKGKVEVKDVPAMSAVSIGLRGRINEKRIAEARGWLEEWLKDHSNEYEAAGPLRVMGYNSPFVPDSRKFTEVQIPVRQID